MTTWFHADDYGITLQQAESILALSSACGGAGMLNSISVFANSPAFPEAAACAIPYVERGDMAVTVHINLVEGAPVSSPQDVSLLVNQRGTFKNDFLGLMRLRGAEAAQQIRRECYAQIMLFLAAFPNQEKALNLDSHQHTHMIPLVFDALMAAAADAGANVNYVRVPVEPVAPHGMRSAFSVNMAKNLLLGAYSRHAYRNMPAGAHTALFSGIMLSGHMEDTTGDVVRQLEAQAARENRDLEILFHPVSMQREDCLDPQNHPFTDACCSPHRDAEARWLAGR